MSKKKSYLLFLNGGDGAFLRRTTSRRTRDIRWGTLGENDVRGSEREKLEKGIRVWKLISKIVNRSRRERPQWILKKKVELSLLRWTPVETGLGLVEKLQKIVVPLVRVQCSISSIIIRKYVTS